VAPVAAPQRIPTAYGEARQGSDCGHDSASDRTDPTPSADGQQDCCRCKESSDGQGLLELPYFRRFRILRARIDKSIESRVDSWGIIQTGL